MIEMRIKLGGEEIIIFYNVHENYIEWYVHSTELTSEHYDFTEIEQIDSIHSLLETLLRMHYTTYIEAQIYEHYHWRMEEQARAYPPDEVF